MFSTKSADIWECVAAVVVRMVWLPPTKIVSSQSLWKKGIMEEISQKYLKNGNYIWYPMKNSYDQVSGGQIQGLTRFCRIGVPKFC